MVYRMGFSTSRSEARQLIRHGHFHVNGRRVTIPSYCVQAGDEVQVREASRKITRIQESVELAQRRGVPEWLEVQTDSFSGKVRALPARSEITLPINEQLIVETILESVAHWIGAAGRIRHGCQDERGSSMQESDLIKPKILDVENKTLTSTYGRFIGEPFERGFGTTLGNALRRILLSSLAWGGHHQGQDSRRCA